MLGVGVGISPSFIGGVNAATPLNGPTLTRTSAAGTNRMSWSSSYPNAIQWDGVDTGDKVDMQWRVNGGSWNADTRQLLDAAALLSSGGFSWPLFGATSFALNDFVEVQERMLQFVGGVLILTGSWSNTISDTMATGTAFLPSTVTSIKDYFKVSTSRCWKDTAGTIAVTADGDAVARWDSEMGVIGSFTQSTLANRPIYRTNAGHPYLEFNGTTDQMDSGAVTIAQPFYAVAAAKVTSLAAAHTLIGTTTVGQRGDLTTNTTPKFQIYASNFVADWGLTPTTNDAVYAGSFNGASSVASIDNTAGTTNNAGTTAPTTIRLGADWNNGQHLVGNVYGYVLVAAIPSVGNKASLNTWAGALQGRTI